jgi:uncharacterized protein (DUF58 family)
MSAHTGTLVVKDFTPSASQTVILLVNFTVRGDTGFTLETLDDTLSTTAASILQYVHDRRLPFGLVAIGLQTHWTGIDRRRGHCAGLVEPERARGSRAITAGSPGA